jgi:hypothetical protein
VAECVDVQTDGSLLAHFGYQNDGAVSIAIPIGENNRLTPGVENMGQPTVFLPGRVTNVFTATFPSTSTLTWILGNAIGDATIATERCQGSRIECTDTDNSKNLALLDNISSDQRKLVRRLANRILALKPSSATRAKALGYLKEADAIYLAQWSEIWGSFSTISKNCTNCAAIDKNANIQALSTRSTGFVALSQKVLRTLRAANRGRVSTTTLAIANRVTSIHQSFLKAAASLPRFESTCN